MNWARAFILATLASMSGVVGCVNRHDLVPDKPAVAAYDGPTDPLDVVLAKINANNARITTVAASGTFEATLGHEHKFLNGGITLIHTKPDKLWLRLDKPAVPPLMVAGTNGTNWWLTVGGDIDTTYYGTQHGLANTDPRLPISPELIGDVLGVSTLSLDMRAEPVPTLRFNPSYDAYMITWSALTTDRWVTLREVWYDRQTLRPERVWLFDRDGRVTVKAVLSDFKAMDVSAGDRGTSPLVSRSYDLTFPANESHMTFRFDEVRATRGKAPNAKTYLFDPSHVSTSKVENLDDVGAAK